MSAVSGFYTFAKGVLTPIMTPWIKFTVTGEENLPAEGGFLLVHNHLSNVDPLCLCWYFMKRNHCSVKRPSFPTWWFCAP